MEFSSKDKELLTKTILIGMPAVGKTALTGYLCDEFEKSAKSRIDLISTDAEIKKVGKDPENKLLQDFIASRGLSKQDIPLIAYNIIEKYGESVFRDFESAVIIDLLNKGEFNNKMVNLGGKAILHPQTSKALKEAGYNCIYLKADSKILLPHVMKDYYAWLGGKEITRSNVNMPIKEAENRQVKQYVSEIKAGKYFSNKEYGAVFKQTRRLLKKMRKETNRARDLTARTIIAKMLYERDAKYALSATATVFVEGDLKKDAQKVMALLKNSPAPANLQSIKNGRNGR